MIKLDDINFEIGDNVRLKEETLSKFNTLLTDNVFTIKDIVYTKVCPIRLNTLELKMGCVEFFKPDELIKI